MRVSWIWPDCAIDSSASWYATRQRRSQELRRTGVVIRILGALMVPPQREFQTASATRPGDRPPRSWYVRARRTTRRKRNGPHRRPESVRHLDGALSLRREHRSTDRHDDPAVRLLVALRVLSLVRVPDRPGTVGPDLSDDDASSERGYAGGITPPRTALGTNRARQPSVFSGVSRRRTGGTASDWTNRIVRDGRLFDASQSSVERSKSCHVAYGRRCRCTSLPYVDLIDRSWSMIVGVGWKIRRPRAIAQSPISVSSLILRAAPALASRARHERKSPISCQGRRIPDYEPSIVVYQPRPSRAIVRAAG